MTATARTINCSSRESHLVEGSPPYSIHGVAIGPNDVTKGSSGITKKWPAEELEQAADSLEGRPLVINHTNDASAVLGRVTKAGWKEDTGVIYEAECYDEDVAEAIDNGDLEVSVRGYHISVEQMERDTETGAKVVENIRFDNLSVVKNGAAPSNTLSMGEHEELSFSELSQSLAELSSVPSHNKVTVDTVHDAPDDTVVQSDGDSLFYYDTASLAEWTTGDWVQWNGGETHGIILLGPELEGEDEPTVEEYKQDDDNNWYPTGTEETISTQSLEAWDVDEDNITTPPEDDEDSEEEAEGYDESDFDVDAGDTVEWHSGHGIVKEFTDNGEVRVEPFAKDDDVWKATGFEVEVDPSDILMWDVAAEIIDRQGATYSTEEAAAEDDYVKWDASGGEANGQVIGRKEDGCYSDEVDGNVEVCAPEDGAVLLIDVYRDGNATGVQVAHHESTVEMWDGPSESDDSEEESEESEEYQPTDGDIVQWQAEPSLFGKIVHVDEEKNIVMVNVMNKTDDGMEETGYTVTAGYEDILPIDDVDDVDSEEMAQNTTELLLMAAECEATTGSMEELDEVYSDWDDAVNMSVSELQDWSENPCSREASVDPQAVIKRNLRLLETNKSDWDENDIADAKRTVSFIERMSEQEPDGDPMDGTSGCPTKWAISMLNWAYNPFDSVPEIPEGAESIEPVELGSKPEGAEKNVRQKGGDKDSQPERWPEGSEEAQSAEMHTPSFDGTRESDSWDALDLEDFTDESWSDLSDEEKEDIAEHFFVSTSGFPPENYTDLKLPVVHPSGELDLAALRAVKSRLPQTDGLGDMEEDIEETANKLATENFDVEWVEENAMKTGDTPHRSSSYQVPDTKIKQYFYEKGKAAGLYEMMSPEKTTSMSKHGHMDSEDDDEDVEEMAYASYDNDEMYAYENGYRDGMERAEKIDVAYSDPEKIEVFCQGMKDGMDPDAPDTPEENGKYQKDMEQRPYRKGHDVGMIECQKNEHMTPVDRAVEKESAGELSEDHMFDAESDAKDMSENMPAPCESGTTHESDGKYMPCASHEQYQDAVDNMPEEEMSACPCTDNTGSKTAGDDLHNVLFAESKAGLASNNSTQTMTETEELEEYDDPVVLERENFEELQSMNDGIEELRERTAILDEVETDLVEELRDSDEPLVIEESRFAELEEEAEHVKSVYAERVAEEAQIFDAEELMEKNTLEELRAKFDEIGGDLEEELEADPRGGDPETEELTGGSKEDDGDSDDVEELAEEKRAELRDKLGIGN